MMGIVKFIVNYQLGIHQKGTKVLWTNIAIAHSCVVTAQCAVGVWRKVP